MQPEMTEIVSLQTVDTVMVYLAVIGPLLGLAIGALVGSMREALAPGLKRGFLFGLLGPILAAAWWFYRYMVRYDPETGYVGLHRMSVFFWNLLIFAVTGAILGAVYAMLRNRWLSDDNTDQTAVNKQE
ncbi:MAG: hypothetical protein R6V19_06335 [Armatimonadota bacterium]